MTVIPFFSKVESEREREQVVKREIYEEQIIYVIQSGRDGKIRNGLEAHPAPEIFRAHFTIRVSRRFRIKRRTKGEGPLSRLSFSPRGLLRDLISA